MDEVDNIIIHSLKEIGCGIDDDVSGLGQLTTEMVVEAAVHCLDVIQPGMGLTRVLPSNMSARFKIGAAIAEACLDLGYRGEVGYQTFLYSNEADIRRVFMFLIEKLPKETEKTVDQPEDEFSKLRRQIAEAFRDAVSVRWRPRSAVLPFLSIPLETGVTLPGQKRDANPKEWHDYCVHKLPYVHQQVVRAEMLVPSLIAFNSRGLATTELVQPSYTNELHMLPPPANSNETTHSWLAIRQKLQFDETSQKQSIKENSTEKPVIEEEESEEERNEKGRRAIESLKQRMEEGQEDVRKLTTKLTQVCVERTRAENKAREKVEGEALRDRVDRMLPESSTNLSRLEEECEAAAQRLLHLAAMWERHRAPLVHRYRAARRRLTERQSERSLQIERVREAREKLLELNEQVAGKELMQARLKEDISKLPKDVSRSAYTQRIMEIIGNISKQKNEIEKVLKDTKVLQKDINSLTGRLERAFTVTDELIFKDAMNDNGSRRAYKLLATLHSDCAELVAMVEDTGAIIREIRDLQDQIEAEKSKNVRANLDRISADWDQMKQESAALRAQLNTL